MKCEEIEPITRAQADRLLRSLDRDAICTTLVRAATTLQDHGWVEAQCLCFASHQDSFVRGVSATCLGHIARIHRVIDEKQVMPVIRQLLHDDDPQTRAIAEDTVEDFSLYLGWNKQKIKKLLAA